MGIFAVTWSTQVEKILPPILRDRTFAPPLSPDTDFVTVDPINNYIEYIVSSAPGHWKEFPRVGVGLWRYLQNNESPQVIRREIIDQLKNDVIPDPRVSISSTYEVTIGTLTFTPSA